MTTTPNPNTKVEKKIKDTEFQCSICKGIFTKDWTDEEAGKEVEHWGECGEMDIVCDDCYIKFMEWHQAKN